MKLKRHLAGILEKRNQRTGEVVFRKEVYTDFFEESLFSKLSRTFDFWWFLSFLILNLFSLYAINTKIGIISVSVGCTVLFQKLLEVINKVNKERKAPSKEHLDEVFQKEFQKFISEHQQGDDIL